MSTASAVLDIKQGLDAAIVTAIASLNTDGRVVIDWGYPKANADDMVLIMGARSQQEWRRTNRTRNEVATVEVHFLTRRSTQQEADARAYAFLELVERQCRVTDPTLGGAVEECVLTATECNGYTDVDNRAAGRFCELIATFTTRSAITG